MSRAVQRLFGRRFIVSGTPWAVAPSEAGPDIAAPVLCGRHNRALRPFDTSALRFFKALALGRDGDAVTIDVDGQHLERWWLKAVVGLLASGHHAVHRVTGEAFQSSPDRDALGVLFDEQPLPHGAGLRFPHEGLPEDTNELLFMQPLHTPGSIDSERILYGVFARCFGVRVMATWHASAPTWPRAPFRPMSLLLGGKTRVRFDWRGAHHSPMELAYEMDDGANET